MFLRAFTSLALMGVVSFVHAQETPTHWVLDGGSIYEFADPETGKAGRWIGNNELGNHDGSNLVFPYKALDVDVNKSFTFCISDPGDRKCKIRYRVLGSKNVKLNSVVLKNGASSGTTNISVVGQLLDEQTGVVLLFLWLYRNDDIVGYRVEGLRITSKSRSEELRSVQGQARAMMDLQSWKEGLSNW